MSGGSSKPGGTRSDAELWKLLGAASSTHCHQLKTLVNFGFYSLLREELAPNGRSSLLELCAPPETWRWSLTPTQGRCGVTGQRSPHPAPGNAARLSLNLTSLKIALPSLYFAGWLDLQLNSQISTNHNLKATVLAIVTGESSLPKSKTKLYPSPALVLQKESPTQHQLSNPECLQMPLWRG